ncbi:MAG: response regulator [Lachnospiraceae bacterium]|nr:response regulator [Lachnospiraceae bacterium]
MSNKDYDRIRQRRIEYLILTVFSVYAICTCVIEYNHGKLWIQYPIHAFLVTMWIFLLFKIGTFQVRSVLMGMLMEISMVFFGIEAKHIQDILVSFVVLIILIGLLEMPRLLILPGIGTVILYVYHLFIGKTIPIDDTGDVLQLIMNILAIYLTIYVVYFLVGEEQNNKIGLLETIEELKLTQRSKDDFLANVSHELRTPINTICGISEIALRDSFEPETRENLINIQSAGKNLLSVVTDILDFSELQMGKIELVEDTYNITSTINDVINLNLPKAMDKNIGFYVDCNIDIPSGLRGDEQKIRRVIMSLVDNAIKFTTEGYIKLIVDYRVEEYGINLCVTVKDTGIGMKQESIGRIFSGFTQLNSQRNRQENGVGLGLSIAQAIIELMGGFITVNSEYGKGSEIQFVIPQAVVEEEPIVYKPDTEGYRLLMYVNDSFFANKMMAEEVRNNFISIGPKIDTKSYVASSIDEVKRRLEQDSRYWVFTGYREYQEEKEYFDSLTNETSVFVAISYGEEMGITNNAIISIYRPLYVVPVVNAINSRLVGHSLSTHKLGKFIAPGAHILVVDDSYMNVKVLQGLLQPYQVRVTTASSGSEALKKITSKDYDFVFMDHMMPEMDGVECFHRIRAMDNIYYKNVPIVALTANAVAGMREMFIKEGFDDFQSKPIEISGLERILKKFIPGKKIKYIFDQERKASHTGESANGPVKIGDLDINKGIAYCGSWDNYLDILKMHRSGGQENRVQINMLFEKEDWENYTIQVHALKSSMMSIGAINLSNLAKGLELAGKSGDIEFIKAGHDRMMEEYGRVLEMLQSNSVIAPGDGAEEEPDDTLLPLSEDEFAEAVKEFEEAAFTFEADNMNVILDKLEQCSYNGINLKKQLGSIRKKVEMSDFMSASEALNEIRDKNKWR